MISNTTTQLKSSPPYTMNITIFCELFSPFPYFFTQIKKKNTNLQKISSFLKTYNCSIVSWVKPKLLSLAFRTLHNQSLSIFNSTTELPIKSVHTLHTLHQRTSRTHSRLSLLHISFPLSEMFLLFWVLKSFSYFQISSMLLLNFFVVFKYCTMYFLFQ